MSVRVLPDAEAVVIAFLRADADVAALVEDRVSAVSGSAPCIRIQRVAGSQIIPGHLDGPRIQVEAWGEEDDDDGTWLIAATAHAVLIGVAGVGGIRGVHDDVVVTDVEEAVGVFSSPDPVSKRPRYLFDIRIALHNAPAA